MGNGIFIALLNPAISAIFAGGFFILWRHQRERRYIGLLAFSYFAAACGYLLQSVTLPFGVALTKLASNTFFVVTACMMALGILGKFGRKVPHLALGLMSGAGLAVLSWFLFVQPDMGWRVLAINFTLAGICLVIAAELRAVKDKIFVDRVLMVALAVNACNFLVRPIVIIAFVGPPVSDGDIFMSLYWITTAVTHAFNSVLLAICLMTGIALEVIGRLRKDALSDPLSGLLNRRGFEERGNARLARRVAEHAPTSLVLADLDHFKDINDKYGHAVGDRVIAAFGTTLRELAGEGAITGRIGGEEFAVILPGRGSAQAQSFAESVRISFANVAIAGLAKATSFTASFGISEWEEGDTLSRMLDRADVALYRAKDNGRNNVCVFSDSMISTAPRHAFG